MIHDHELHHDFEPLPSMSGAPPRTPPVVALVQDDDFRDLVARIELVSPPRMRVLVVELKRRLGLG